MKGKRRTKTRVLRGYIWIDNLLKRLEISPAEFARRYVEKHDSHKLGHVYKWLSRVSTPSLRLVNRVASQLPGSDRVFNLPLFELLDVSTKISLSRLDDITQAPYFSHPYEFLHVTSPLLALNDAYSTISLRNLEIALCRLRKAKAIGNTDEFLVAAILTAFYLVCARRSIDWVDLHFTVFKELTEELLADSPVSCLEIEVNWGKLTEAANQSLLPDCVGLSIGIAVNGPTDDHLLLRIDRKRWSEVMRSN